MTALLDVRDVTKRFGGVVANDRLSLSVRAGEIVGIMGPNGAGKSTLFDVITGFYKPDSGRVAFDGRDVTGRRADQINRLGVARTFQKLRPFADMTTLENVLVADLPRSGDVAAAERAAREQIELVGLADRADVPARFLSTGQRKRLELARAMATRPRLLLLDEVTGGVDQRSIPGLVELVRSLRARGVTLIVIEHNVRVLMDLCSRVIALNRGAKIGDGSPADVAADPEVIRAYIGTSFVAGAERSASGGAGDRTEGAAG